MFRERDKKDSEGDVLKSVAESTLGVGLLNAMIAKQRCVEQGMKDEERIFEDSIQRFRTELSGVGLNPDEVINERLRLLKKALGE